MSASSPPDVNFWFDKRCARAFWSQCELPPYRELLTHTTEWMAPASGEHWLDLGCGSGQLTRALWDQSEGRVASIVAVDCAAANDEAIALLRDSLAPRPAPERISFRQVDFSHGLPAFDEKSFDGIVSGLSIQYAQHYSPAEGRWTTSAYDGLLSEARRVLRPGGRFVFSVNVPNPAWMRIALHGIPSFFRTPKPLRFFRNSMRMMRYGSWLKQEAARGRFHYLPAEEIRTKLVAAGFERIEHRVSYARQAFLFRAYRPA
jgi:ubiquinone/menaquinone biosynthesis C-methylase UbiE